MICSNRRRQIPPESWHRICSFVCAIDIFLIEKNWTKSERCFTVSAFVIMNIKRFIYGLFATSILCAGAQTTKSQVVINEALASNSSYTSPIYDIEPDWIELYNNGTSAVDLGGMSLSISATNPRQFTFPAGVTIPARGYYLIACSTKFPKSEHNTVFNLSAFGETINLYSASSTPPQLILWILVCS